MVSWATAGHGGQPPHPTMTEQTQQRTTAKRFDGGLDPNDLIVGDHIHNHLVAEVPEHLGKSLCCGAPEMEILKISKTRIMPGLHRILLVDPDTRVLATATKTDEQQFWTVRDVGKRLVVEDGTAVNRPDDEQDEPEQEWVDTWIQILIQEHQHGYHDYDDELTMTARGRIELYDPFDSRKGVAEISLEKTDD